MVMELGAGLGISGKVGNRRRLAVNAPFWGDHPFATDYWFSPMDPDIITASAPHLLTALGWTSNGTLSVVAPDGTADLFSTSDVGVIGHLLFNTANERVLSPKVFGSYETTYFIRDQLGWTPTKLCAEWWGLFTTSSNSEAGSGWGFTKGAIDTATNGIGVFASDGTNFRVKTSGAAFVGALTGPAIDNVQHRFKLVLDSGQAKVFAYMDGTAVASSLTLLTDVFPCHFAAGTAASNVLGLGNLHIWYE